MIMFRRLLHQASRLSSSSVKNTTARPTIDIYFLPESPPCRTVEMVAEMVDVNLNKHLMNLFKKDHHQEDHVRLNPRRKVPFIIDGPIRMGESRAIARYLVNRYKPDDEHLYPKDPINRALIDDMLDFELGTLYSSAFRLLSPKLFASINELDPAENKTFNHALKYLDSRLYEVVGNKYLFGDHITIADLSMAASFTFPLACDYDISQYKHITSYLDRLQSTIPRYSEINDEPTRNMRALIQSKE